MRHQVAPGFAPGRNQSGFGGDDVGIADMLAHRSRGRAIKLGTSFFPDDHRPVEQFQPHAGGRPEGGNALDHHQADESDDHRHAHDEGGVGEPNPRFADCEQRQGSHAARSGFGFGSVHS
jgi:hypothetical protein